MTEWKNAISDALAAEITSLLRGRWQDCLATGETFEVSGEYAETELAVRVALIHGPQGANYRLEAGVNWEENALTREDAIYALLDLLDGYVGDYLEEGRDERVPLDWQPVEVDGRTIRVRGVLTYPNLEDQANLLLDEDD